MNGRAACPTGRRCTDARAATFLVARKRSRMATPAQGGWLLVPVDPSRDPADQKADRPKGVIVACARRFDEPRIFGDGLIETLLRDLTATAIGAVPSWLNRGLELPL